MPVSVFDNSPDNTISKGVKMDSVFVVIAIGPNAVEVPCMLFQTKQEADDKMVSLGLELRGGAHPYYSIPFVREEEIAELFFTSYYDGCGGISGFYITEVKFGEKFVGWDLD